MNSGSHFRLSSIAAAIAVMIVVLAVASIDGTAAQRQHPLPSPDKFNFQMYLSGMWDVEVYPVASSTGKKSLPIFQSGLTYDGRVCNNSFVNDQVVVSLCFRNDSILNLHSKAVAWRWQFDNNYSGKMYAAPVADDATIDDVRAMSIEQFTERLAFDLQPSPLVHFWSHVEDRGNHRGILTESAAVPESAELDEEGIPRSTGSSPSSAESTGSSHVLVLTSGASFVLTTSSPILDGSSTDREAVTTYVFLKRTKAVSKGFLNQWGVPILVMIGLAISKYFSRRAAAIPNNRRPAVARRVAGAVAGVSNSSSTSTSSAAAVPAASDSLGKKDK